MSITAIQFWQLLESSGTISTDGARLLAADMANETTPDQMIDPIAVGNWLLQKKHITSYQLKILLGQKNGPIRCGSYIVQSELPDKSLANWYRAKHSSADGDFWLFAIPESYLASPEFMENPPSLKLARAHAKLREPFLNTLSEPQMSDGYLCFASNLLPGRSLASTMQGVAMPVEIAQSIILQTAMAVDRLHESQLVHGNIGLHSIWWDGDQSICLVRDPLFIPSNPMASSSTLSVIQTSASERLRYAAPEFTAPGQSATVSTDLYAIGCVWYELLTGQPLIPESQPTTMIKSVISLKREPIQADGFDKISQRLLDHLLARNPASRFSSARQFLNAVQAAKQNIHASPVQLSVAAPVALPISSKNTSAKIANGIEANADKASQSERKAWQDKPQQTPSNVAKPKSTPADQTKQVKPLGSSQSSVKDASVKDATVKDATVKDATVKDATVKDATVKDATVKDATVKDATVKETQLPAATNLNQKPAGGQNSTSVGQSTLKRVPTQATTNRVERTEATDAKTQVTQATEDVPATSPSQTNTSGSVAKLISIPIDPAAKPAQIPLEIKSKSPEQSVAPEAKSEDTAVVEKQAEVQNVAPKKSISVQSKVKATAGKPITRSRSSKKKKPIWFLPAAGGASLVLMIGLISLLMYSGETTVTKPKPNPIPIPAAPVRDRAPTEIAQTPPQPIDPVASEYNLVSDNQFTLWAPPKVIDPLRLNLLPPGLQGVLALNIANINQKPVYESIHQVLEPAYPLLISYFNANLPVPFRECKEIVIGLYPSDVSEWPILATRVDLQTAKPIQEIVSKFGFTTPIEELKFGSTLLLRNSNSSVAVLMEVDPGDSTRSSRMVIGPPKLIEELVAVEGGVAPLTPALEVLRLNSSAANDFTYFTSTSLLLTSGRGVLQNSLSVLLPYLQIEMQEQVAAIGLSSHIDALWYGELRLVGKDAQTAPAIQSKLKAIVQTMPDQAEAALPAFSSNAYWAKLAFRYPQQLRTWQSNIRVGSEADHTVANFYLPTKAAPNLLTSTWMALRVPVASTALEAATGTPNVKPLSMEEILKLPVTIGFDQESLEAGSREIATAFNAGLNNPLSAIQIEIDGAALEKDGITRNQQIRDFKHENKPFREVLISLVRKANPVTTVQNANDKDQKLVWVVKDADKRIIQVTTRAAAQTASMVLPDEFVIPK